MTDEINNIDNAQAIISPEFVASLFPHLAPQEKPAEIKFKYGEDAVFSKALEYVKSTYGQHYVGENDVQTIDIWASLGSAPTTTRDTAIKYLMRYGKKDGYNEKDLLKAIHYTVLLYYFTQVKK